MKTESGIIATKCKRPKMRHHRGRTWDLIAVRLNGADYQGHFDTSWGHNIYFEVAGQWYRVPVQYCNDNATLIDLDAVKNETK